MTDTLFHGGTIITVDGDNPYPAAVAVRDGKISFAGALGEAKATLSPDHDVVDLNGAVLLPGFIDAHSHPLWAAKTRGAPVVDVRAETVPTYAALIAKVRRRVAVAKPGEYLLFFGLDAQLHPDMEAPTRAFLDTIAPDNPIGIQTSNCHALFMNSAGFEACGIDETFETPTGSIIERDESNRPTGKIEEAITWAALETFYQAWGDDRLSTEFEAAINELVSNGITAVTEHLYLPFYKAYYLNALKRGLPLPRVAAYQQATTADMQVENMLVGDDRLWMAGVKIHADGSPFIGNIWLTKPYLESEITLERMHLKPGHTGSLNYPQDYFEKMVRTYFSAGWQMTVHTQGDRTIDMVLDLVETVLEEMPHADHRFRLEHCALMRSDQIERAQQLGVICSFFINHITHWGAPIEDALFGPERAAHYMPAGTAVAEGMRISLHADTPMTDPSALELMQAATTRIAGDGRCLGESECLDIPAALRSVTIDAAYQIGMEDRLGSITPGKHADLVVLDTNPLESEPSKLRDIGVQSTWLAGECVWSHD
ncbi:MAG: amidohydrolase family protein [Hyphomicrobiales bacterium]